jgi:hypothetical protein
MSAPEVTTTDTAFEMTTSNIRFGPGVTREVGPELRDMQVGASWS